MKKIDSMSFKIDGLSLYYAVWGGMQDSHGFSEISCTSGSFVCWVDTLSKAEWFANQGFVGVSGVATLRFGSSRRSQTEMDKEQRELQSKNDEEMGKFTMKFPVITFQETTMGHNVNGSSLDDVSAPQCILLLLLCYHERYRYFLLSRIKTNLKHFAREAFVESWEIRKVWRC